MSQPEHPVVVTVQPEYAVEHSDPARHRYVFIYHVCIRNQGSMPVQLLSRYWLITDANGHEEEVRGAGVVGEQPLINAGEEHCYNSFCVLETSAGCMQGSYQMLAADGQRFDVPIPAFTLAVPGSLN